MANGVDEKTLRRFTRRIIRKRVKASSQQVVAREICTSQCNVSGFLTGRFNPGMSVITRWLRLLGYDVKYQPIKKVKKK